MDYFLSMLVAVAVLMLCLMAYIVAHRDPWQSARDALAESVAWGIGGFVSFAVEILLVWKLAW